jgi:DNA sulfur modification protein DndC
MVEIPTIPIDKYIEIRELMKKAYLADSRPWIVGFSGGKDSTLVTQLTFSMLMSLPPEDRKKEVHIITSDTLVETPLIQTRIKKIHEDMKQTVEQFNLPIKVALIEPSINETFWVNLIGRGYPSPNKWFRWCTDRLKIRPATRYIYDQVKVNGEVIIVLGTRSAESATRAQSMKKHKIKGIQFRKHEIQGAFVFSPIEGLDNAMTWSCLRSVSSPWGGNNAELENLYRKADKECPMVVDDSSESCGGSRFGCWVCTVVKKDRSVEGLIEDGEEWLQPLLDFRNWLHEIRDDKTKREETRKIVRKSRWMAEYFGEENFKDERKVMTF